MDVNRRKRRRRKRITICKHSQRQKIESVITNAQECCFCKQDGSVVSLGTFFSDTNEKIAAHQFCLLFSAGLPQLGEDEEGFDGFIFTDIKKEATRASKINCKFCNNAGASSGCAVKTCRQTYHVTCGIKSNVQFMFQGSFETLCPVHRTEQDLSYITCTTKSPCTQLQCPICLEEIEHVSIEILKMPCCRNKFAHKECIQSQACVSGYFFKCPFCNNEEDFQQEMAKYGIYIPQRDAAWEENNAFSELLEQYTKCDWPQCKCIYGRTYNDEGAWLLLRCYHCGQSAVHKRCLGKFITPIYDYVCPDCNDVIGAASTTVSITPERIDERTQTHKRLLAELTARSDPLLLASPVLGPGLLRQKFNVKECRVVVTSLPDVILNNMKHSGRRIHVNRFMWLISCKDDISFHKKRVTCPRQKTFEGGKKLYSSSSENTTTKSCHSISSNIDWQRPAGYTSDECSLTNHSVFSGVKARPSTSVVTTPSSSAKDASKLPPIATLIELSSLAPVSEHTPTGFSKTAAKIKNITIKRPLHTSSGQSSKKLKLAEANNDTVCESPSSSSVVYDTVSSHNTRVQRLRKEQTKLFIKFPFKCRKEHSVVSSPNPLTANISFQNYYRLHSNNDAKEGEKNTHSPTSAHQNTGRELACDVAKQSSATSLYTDDSNLTYETPTCVKLNKLFESQSQMESICGEEIRFPKDKECTSNVVCNKTAKEESKKGFSCYSNATKKTTSSGSCKSTCENSMTLLDAWLHKPRSPETKKQVINERSFERIFLDRHEEDGNFIPCYTQSPNIIAGTPVQKCMKSIVALNSEPIDVVGPTVVPADGSSETVGNM